MSYPASPPPVPRIVARLAAGRAVHAVWTNELGGVTYRVGPGAEFIKVGRGNFAGEARRLRWAAPYVTVPPVLGVGTEDGLAWLRTGGLRGLSAVHPRRRASPDTAVRAIGAGLRRLHDSLPVSLGWNYPDPGWDAEFFAAYGVQPDPVRIGYYRRLWRAGDPDSR